MIKIMSRVLGMVSTNCYLLINPDNNESIIVDPADSPDLIKEMVEKSDTTPKAILLTHGHFDHVGAALELKSTYGIKIYASRHEEKLLASPDINLSSEYGMNISIVADVLLEDGEELNLAGFAIKAIHTPGHTAGSMCYYFAEESMLISGDTLFAYSIGRTDFPTSSSSDMMTSLRDKLAHLPKDTDVFPGHGECTTIGFELENNPYM